MIVDTVLMNSKIVINDSWYYVNIVPLNLVILLVTVILESLAR